MRTENNDLPNYRTFVFALSFWIALGAAVSITGFAGIVATMLLVFFYNTHAPTPQELYYAYADWVAISVFTAVWMVMLVVQHDRWESLFRHQPTAPRQTPRPLASRGVSEVQRLTSQMAIGQRQYFPVFVHHCKALYLRLQRNKWKITKRVLDFEVETVKVFPNIGEKYMGIIAEWNRLGFVDGYVTGEAREKWFLNEAGQAHFADMGNVSE